MKGCKKSGNRRTRATIESFKSVFRKKEKETDKEKEINSIEEPSPVKVINGRLPNENNKSIEVENVFALNEADHDLMIREALESRPRLMKRMQNHRNFNENLGYESDDFQRRF